MRGMKRGKSSGCLLCGASREKRDHTAITILVSQTGTVFDVSYLESLSALSNSPSVFLRIDFSLLQNKHQNRPGQHCPVSDYGVGYGRSLIHGESRTSVYQCHQIQLRAVSRFSPSQYKRVQGTTDMIWAEFGWLELHLAYRPCNTDLVRQQPGLRYKYCLPLVLR